MFKKDYRKEVIDVFNSDTGSSNFSTPTQDPDRHNPQTRDRKPKQEKGESNLHSSVETIKTTDKPKQRNEKPNVTVEAEIVVDSKYEPVTQLVTNPHPNSNPDDGRGIPSQGEATELNPKCISDLEEDLLAREINDLHYQTFKKWEELAEYYIKIGETLIKAKETIGHGKWELFVDEKLTIGPKQVSNYMRIYHKRDEIRQWVKIMQEIGINQSRSAGVSPGN